MIAFPLCEGRGFALGHKSLGGHGMQQLKPGNIVISLSLIKQVLGYTKHTIWTSSEFVKAIAYLDM